VTRIVDLLTDADTLPPLGMRQVMSKEYKGLELAGTDTVTTLLEERVAKLLGKEAGMFCPTVIMGDLIAVLAYCNRGDEVIVGDQSHIYNNEIGGVSALGGVFVRTVRNDHRGMMSPKEIEAAIRPIPGAFVDTRQSKDHKVSPVPSSARYYHTGLVCTENTHQRSGGRSLSIEDQHQIAKVAHDRGMPVYCDGARFNNAALAQKVSVAELAKDIDAICFGFGKSLGVYAGSVLCGTADFIERALKLRYMLGGTLSRSGWWAAACLWALDHMQERIQEDHANAKLLAEGIANIKGLSINSDEVETQIVMFKVDCMKQEDFIVKLAKRKVLCWAIGERIRMVTDNTVTRSDIEYTIDAIQKVLKD